MASIVERPWRPVTGPSSPKNVHCLSGAIENVDNKRQNIGNPLSPPRSSSPTGPTPIDVDSDSSEGSIPNTPPRPTSSSTTGSSVGLNTTKSRTGSFASSVPPTVLPIIRDTSGPKAPAKQHQGIEFKLQCDWNRTHGSPRDLLSNPPSPQYAEQNKGHGAADNERARITLPSLDIPKLRANSDPQTSVYNAQYMESNPSLRQSSNNISDGGRRASFASERASWTSSPPTSMPPPPLPSQSCAPQLELFPRIVERAPGIPRTNPLSVSELIHRDATGTELPPTPRAHAAAAAGDRVPSLVNEFIDILKLRERVSDANMPKFLEELDHQLSLTGLLREARELICSSFELADRQRSLFAQQTRGMLKVDEPARDMREVVTRAVASMSRRDMAGFEHEVVHMLDGSLHKPASPYREAICCATYAARFPEDQQTELRRQLKRTPLAAFQSRQQQQQQPHSSAAGSSVQQPRAHNLPPPRECEKLVDLRRAGAGAAKVRKDPPRPANYSLREFPIFSTH